MPNCPLGLTSSIVKKATIQNAAHGEVRVVHHARRRGNVKQNGEKHGVRPITHARANQNRQTNIFLIQSHDKGEDDEGGRPESATPRQKQLN